MRFFLCICILISCFFKSFSQTISFQIKTKQERSSISPYIYGFNFDDQLPNYGAPEKYKSFRLGGNRLTAYNWENNASNSGSDANYSNDNYLCGMVGVSNCAVPGEVFVRFHQQNKLNGIYSLVTLPLAGYVAADKNGAVSSSQFAPSSRFKQIKHIKGSAFSLSPDLTDAYVYSDEFVNYLTKTLGTADNGGIQGYSIDNEPELWNTTHNEVHPTAVGALELMNGNISLSKVIKSIDSKAEVYGGVFYGFSGYYYLQNAADWNSVKGTYNWYIDYFLDNFKQQSTLANTRLLDVLDIHWYPEATGDNRIIDNGANTANDQQARMQAPRSLWDPNYSENSWIADYFSAYLPLIPRINTSINSYYPGTKLSISEYNYGGGGDISGGIAQADVLGIFGAYNVYSAHLWPIYNSDNTFFQSAFRIYTNYDANGAHFGSTHVYAKTSDSVNTSLYAAVSGLDDDTLHLMVINKTNTEITGDFSLDATYNIGNVWQFKNDDASISNVAKFAVNTTTFSYSVPALSVSIIELTKAKVLPVHILNFDGSEEDNKVILKWKTVDESDINSFDLESSKDGIHFTSVVVTKAHNQPGENEYLTEDANGGETNYYRLKINENNNRCWFSSILKLSHINNRLKIFPNPVKDNLYIQHLSGLPTTFIVMDHLGRKVLEKHVNANEYNLDINFLARGSYFIQILTSASSHYFPFIKKD